MQAFQNVRISSCVGREDLVMHVGKNEDYTGNKCISNEVTYINKYLVVFLSLFF